MRKWILLVFPTVILLALIVGVVLSCTVVDIPAALIQVAQAGR